MLSAGHATESSDPYKDLYEKFFLYETSQDWSKEAELIYPPDLDHLKQLIATSYELAKAKMDKDKSVSSLAFTTFPSREAIDSTSPKEIFIAVRRKTSPPEARKSPPIEYIGHRVQDGTIFIDLSVIPPNSKDPFKFSFELKKENENLYLRLPKLTEQMIQAEIERNTKS